MSNKLTKAKIRKMISEAIKGIDEPTDAYGSLKLSLKGETVAVIKLKMTDEYPTKRDIMGCVDVTDCHDGTFILTLHESSYGWFGSHLYYEPQITFDEIGLLTY